MKITIILNMKDDDSISYEDDLGEILKMIADEIRRGYVGGILNNDCRWEVSEEKE